MSKLFITIQGGLGNQLFQAALIIWLRSNLGISVQPIDPGSQGKPGPYDRICQIDQLFPAIRIRRGFIAHLLHIASLSRKWQCALGKIGLVNRIADEVSLSQILRRNLRASNFRGFFRLYVLSAHLQSLKLVKPVIPSMIKNIHPVLTKRAFHIDNMLSRSNRPPLAATLVVHVRRGDVLTLQNSELLGYDYYKNALDAIVKKHGFCPSAIAVVSDEPEIALGLIQQISPSAYLLNFDDPIDVLSAMAMAYGLVLANSTLSLWGAIFSVNRCNIVGPCIPSLGNCDWFHFLSYLDVTMVASAGVASS